MNGGSTKTDVKVVVDFFKLKFQTRSRGPEVLDPGFVSDFLHACWMCVTHRSGSREHMT
jgi:hypothetical protein